jgi:hypothetical protein
MAEAVKALDASLSEQEFVEFLRNELYNRSVAIVGSSPRLLESEHGDTIDSHDVVIRFNDARTAGLGRHAGCRTDIRFVGCTIKERHAAFFSNLEEDSVVITKETNRGKIPTAGIRDLKFLAFSIHKNAFALADVVLNSSFADHNSKPPRTGFALLSYILASDVALQGASLFGMERTARKSGRAHFYKDNQSLEHVFKSHHLYHAELEAELTALNMMIDKLHNLIQFY